MAAATQSCLALIRPMAKRRSRVVLTGPCPVRMRSRSSSKRQLKKSAFAYRMSLSAFAIAFIGAFICVPHLQDVALAQDTSDDDGDGIPNYLDTCPRNSDPSCIDQHCGMSTIVEGGFSMETCYFTYGANVQCPDGSWVPALEQCSAGTGDGTSDQSGHGTGTGTGNGGGSNEDDGDAFTEEHRRQVEAAAESIFRGCMAKANLAYILCKANLGLWTCREPRDKDEDECEKRKTRLIDALPPICRSDG